MKRDDILLSLIAVAVILLAVGLGYRVGSSGPWRAYASALEHIVDPSGEHLVDPDGEHIVDRS